MDGEVRKEVLDFLEAMKMSFALIDDHLDHENFYMAKQVAYGSLLGVTDRLKEVKKDIKSLDSEKVKDLEKTVKKMKKDLEKERARHEEKEKSLLDDLESLKKEKEEEEARKKRNRDKIMGRLSELQESKKPS